MDIYYVHMFISNYFLSQFIYSINNVFFMVIVVIILSLIWSYILDVIRKIISFDKILLTGSDKIQRLLYK